jgi:ubiquitin-conjugating enzyme E2 J2
MSQVSLARLRKEYKELIKKPVENIRAAPKESNILEWHYVIEGPKGSVYEGGFYHGTLTFPSEYPFKPPSIQMTTPNGRFKPNTRLCLSMSDFHPESWNPMWSVGTILMGLYSFMLEETATYGSITTTDSFKRSCAKISLEFNSKNKVFAELFPELIELHEKRKKELQEEENNENANNSSDNTSNGNKTKSIQNKQGVKKGGALIDTHQPQQASWTAIFGVLLAIIACTWAILALAI